MLKELPVFQARGEPRRRWFADEHFDLIVWLAADDKIDAFQLCYNRGHSEHALTWDRTCGYSHDRIDDGEGSPTRNRSPVLVADGPFRAGEILEHFEAASTAVDAAIRILVVEKLRAYLAHAAQSL